MSIYNVCRADGEYTRQVFAGNPHQAAEMWADWVDWSTAEFSIIKGEAATVLVREVVDEAEGPCERYIVTGRSERVYTAGRAEGGGR